MLKRRIRILAVVGITIVAAIVSTTLGATGARAASAAPALAASGCVEIELGNGGDSTSQILDEGVHNDVTLAPAPASCWVRSTKPDRVEWYGVWYNAYEYQDVRGHCLWDDNGVLQTAAGPCKPGVRGEEFFGIRYYHNGYDAPGWALTDDYWGPRYYIAAPIPVSHSNGVFFYYNGSPGTPHEGGAPFWNFP